MICEMCGKETNSLQRISVEGTVLNVCRECARFGTPIAGDRHLPSSSSSLSSRLEKREKRLREKDIFGDEEYVLAEDYSVRIRRGRERMGLSQEELAIRLAEKKSVIAKLEKGDMRPDNELIKKIEHHLSISLREPVKEVSPVSGRGRRTLTLGDLIKMEMEKKKNKTDEIENKNG